MSIRGYSILYIAKYPLLESLRNIGSLKRVITTFSLVNLHAKVMDSVIQDAFFPEFRRMTCFTSCYRLLQRVMLDPYLS